jgi:hypothetical protein
MPWRTRIKNLLNPQQEMDALPAYRVGEAEEDSGRYLLPPDRDSSLPAESTKKRVLNIKARRVPVA